MLNTTFISVTLIRLIIFFIRFNVYLISSESDDYKYNMIAFFFYIFIFTFCCHSNTNYKYYIINTPTFRGKY
jgi:hypothetical protein